MRQIRVVLYCFVEIFLVNCLHEITRTNSRKFHKFGKFSIFRFAFKNCNIRLWNIEIQVRLCIELKRKSMYLPIVIKLLELFDISGNFKYCVGSFLFSYVKCVFKIFASAIDRLHFSVIENVFFLWFIVCWLFFKFFNNFITSSSAEDIGDVINCSIRTAIVDIYCWLYIFIPCDFIELRLMKGIKLVWINFIIVQLQNCF